MGRSLNDRLRQFEADKDRWLQERTAQASLLERDLENAGRQAWNDATRAGVNLVARTPQELRALGAEVLRGHPSHFRTLSAWASQDGGVVFGGFSSTAQASPSSPMR